MKTEIIKYSWHWQLKKMQIMNKPKSEIAEMKQYITKNNLWNKSILEA